MNMTSKRYNNLANGALKMSRSRKYLNLLKALKNILAEAYKKCKKNWIFWCLKAIIKILFP